MVNFKVMFLAIVCSCLCIFSSVLPVFSANKVIVIPLNSGGKNYSGVTTVAKSGGNYTSPFDAWNDRASWCPSSPCLMKIMPGNYDIGTNNIQLISYVDIEGSGENTTTISSAFCSSTRGTISTAYGNELRFLRVENNCGPSSFSTSIAIYSVNSSPTLTHMTAKATGGILGTYAVYNKNNFAKLNHVTAIADGSAIYSYGVFNDDSAQPTIRDSTITGLSYSIRNVPLSLAKVANTQLRTVVSGNDDTFSCVGVFDDNYSLLDANCDP